MKNSRLEDFLKIAIKASVEAGAAVMQFHGKESLQVKIKNDLSPVTAADQEANRILMAYLTETGIPIISEEAKIPSYKIRKTWKEIWIIDPIDGTRSFIKGEADFTINAGYISENEAIMGLIYAPFTRELFYGLKGLGAYKHILESHDFNPDNIMIDKNRISGNSNLSQITIAVTRSRFYGKTKKFVERMQKAQPDVKLLRKGSSLKYCLVAEGKANIFPRFGIVHEWDTAAGQAIAEASGCYVDDVKNRRPVVYNKKRLITNPNIVAASENLIKKCYKFEHNKA